MDDEQEYDEEVEEEVEDFEAEFKLSSKALSAVPKIQMMQAKLNNPIRLQMQKPTGFKSGSTYSSNTSSSNVFTIPPLNAVISTAFGKPAVSGSRSFNLFRAAPQTNLSTLQFLNWASTGKNTFDDPNKHRNVILKNYRIDPVFNQLCCGACWAVSTSTAFSDRYGILNDEKPIKSNILSIMSCCTGGKYKNVFGVVATPDCNIMSSYDELGSSNSSMGMCSGGIPYSAGLSIWRNGIPEVNAQPYNSTLFDCNGNGGTDLNRAIIDKYPCEKKLFASGKRIRMSKADKPVYISSSMDSRGPPEHYVNMMKKALLEGGPLVGGFMTMADFIGMGSVNVNGAAADNGGTVSWDSTGKVYVPGAYDKIWPFTPINSVGGVSTVNFIAARPGKNTEVVDTGIKEQAAIGEIFCGFHAVVIVGWGELDMKYVKNKTVKTTTSPVDKRPKLPFWICRNSWGTSWPSKDGQNYYEGGLNVTVNGKDSILNVPAGYWLHAMYPNESLALDVPIIYEGTDYGSTMVMTPLRSNSPGPTPKPGTNPPATTNPTTRAPIKKGTLPPKKLVCDTKWVDNEGYSCKDYSHEKWCTSGGKNGSGWKERWGAISDFANKGKDALQACCECGGGKVAAATVGDRQSDASTNDNTTERPATLVEIVGITVGSICIIIIMVSIVFLGVVERDQTGDAWKWKIVSGVFSVLFVICVIVTIWSYFNSQATTPTTSPTTLAPTTSPPANAN